MGALIVMKLGECRKVFADDGATQLGYVLRTAPEGEFWAQPFGARSTKCKSEAEAERTVRTTADIPQGYRVQ